MGITEVTNKDVFRNKIMFLVNLLFTKEMTSHTAVHNIKKSNKVIFAANNIGTAALLSLSKNQFDKYNKYKFVFDCTVSFWDLERY